VFEIGETLREARTRKGWSLKDAEDRTKIRSKYLQALEHDDFSVIPGPTFVRGFLRTYAGFLDLDAALLVEEYRARYEPEPDNLPLLRPSASQLRTRDRPRRRQGGTVVAGVLAVVIILVLAWIGWGNHRQAPAEIRSGNVTSSTSVSATTTRTSGKTTAATAKGSGKTTAKTSATTTEKAGATATSTGTGTTSAAGGAQ
jgi:cytoskeleton protein RodZ